MRLGYSLLKDLSGGICILNQNILKNYIYIYIYIYVCVCVRARARVCVFFRISLSLSLSLSQSLPSNNHHATITNSLLIQISLLSFVTFQNSLSIQLPNMGNNFRALYQCSFQSALDVKNLYRKSFTTKYLLSTVIPNKTL